MLERITLRVNLARRYYFPLESRDLSETGFEINDKEATRFLVLIKDVTYDPP